MSSKKPQEIDVTFGSNIGKKVMIKFPEDIDINLPVHYGIMKHISDGNIPMITDVPCISIVDKLSKPTIDEWIAYDRVANHVRGKVLDVNTMGDDKLSNRIRKQKHLAACLIGYDRLMNDSNVLLSFIDSLCSSHSIVIDNPPSMVWYDDTRGGYRLYIIMEGQETPIMPTTITGEVTINHDGDCYYNISHNPGKSTLKIELVCYDSQE